MGVNAIEYTQTNGAFDLKVFREEALCEDALVAVLQMKSLVCQCHDSVISLGNGRSCNHPCSLLGPYQNNI